MSASKSKPSVLGKVKQAHTSNSKVGGGDFTGMGIKNPVGVMRDSYMINGSKASKGRGKPPKSLA